MIAALCALLPLLATAGAGWPAERLREADYADRLCTGWAREVRTSEGTFADCVSPTHAIEVDFSEKWAEAIGQSLHYAEQLDRRAGVILVCRNAGLCFAHANRMRRIVNYHRLPVTLWMCTTESRSLEDCLRFEPPEGPVRESRAEAR